MLPTFTHQWECKIMKRQVSINTLMKVLNFNTLNTNDEMRNHVMRYVVLILQGNFHDVWVEFNGTL